MDSRMRLADFLLIAGVKPTIQLPRKLRVDRGLKVKPKKSKLISGYVCLK
jgi:hypothetical protein